MPKFSVKYSSPGQVLHTELNSLTKWGLGFIIFAGILISIAISTPYWLQNTYDPTLANMGLWLKCSTSSNYDNYNYRANNQNQYYGRDGQSQSLNLFGDCKWIQVPYGFPWAFLAIQIAFLITWILVLIASGIVIVSPFLKRDVPLKSLSILLIVSAVLGLSAIILFAIMKESWPLRSNDNYISWSFVLAVLGVLVEVGCSIILIVFKSRQHDTTIRNGDIRIY